MKLSKIESWVFENKVGNTQWGEACDPNLDIDRPWNATHAESTHVTFIKDDWFPTQAGAIFCSKAHPELAPKGALLIITPNPKLQFVKFVTEFFPPPPNTPFTGKNVNIGMNCSIGGEGFGYVQDEDGTWIKFPHYGQVIIKDNVDIGNNVCIDRGALSNTIIDSGTKIDNLVHIAHNVRIGKNTMVIANSMIAGSVVIGDNCWIAPSSSIKNGVKIGNNVTIGMGAVVLKDVADNKVMIGNPAKELIKNGSK